MIACIEATSIPTCTVGLFYALPNTQLTRRLSEEGRMFSVSYTEERAAMKAGDQCTSGLNFQDRAAPAGNSRRLQKSSHTDLRTRSLLHAASSNAGRNGPSFAGL